MPTPPDDASSAAARTIAAIVVSYHTGPVLFSCLDRLTGEALVGEIIIVDNGNPPDVSAALGARAGGDGVRVDVIAGQGNVGFARACNLGAARARLPFLAFINPDALVEPGALAAMLAAGAGAPAPWIVGARLIGPDGREQRGARRDAITLWSAAVAGLRLGGLERWIRALRDPHRERDPVPSGPVNVGAVSGAAMVIRAADFAALGGFDEAYFLHVDDIDLCRRAREAGGAVIFQPAARVVHIGATSEIGALFVARRKAEALAYYFRKFAASPAEMALANLAAPCLYALALAGGLVRAARAGLTRR
jgi:N-acetylglucosaminyl-diphospho-decaprenol L-rhamnosyltransferase